jgi:peptidylprolyl isomerase/peptidyl-prolyl cis-trans isomerase C
MTRLLATAVAAAGLWAALGPMNPSRAEAPDADRVIAIVNGTEIHESDLAVIDQMMGRNIPSMQRDERREAVLNLVTDSILLAQMAEARHVVDQADIDRRVAFARNQGLADNLLIVAGKEAVTDESEHKLYDAIVEKMPAQPEVHLRQIFFRLANAGDEDAVKAAQEKAEAALKRLRATAPNGGDQGWHIRGELGKEIFDAGMALKPGELTLVKTAAGLHILRLEDRRERKPPAFDQVKDRLAAMVEAKARRDLIDKARESAKIERIETSKAEPKSN